MTTALADRPSQPTTSRSSARKAPVGSKRVRRLAPSAAQLSPVDPAEATVAADVMAVLAAFGLED